MLPALRETRRAPDWENDGDPGLRSLVEVVMATESKNWTMKSRFQEAEDSTCADVRCDAR